MSLVVFTALVGLLVAPGHVHPVIGFTALLCIAIGAGASGALNMWYDADIDAVMTRTARRPIPAGRVQPGEALAFGSTLAVGSVLVLGVLVNWFAAALLAFTIFFYVVVYTMWLKRSTPQNIVIGGAAGAFPPMIGWAAVTGDIGLAPVLLFLIIFFWTPPHFWALSLLRADDYARAGVPMLPVVAGPRRDAQADPALFARARAGRRRAVAVRLCRRCSTARSRSSCGALMLALAWRVYRDRSGPAAAAAARRAVRLLAALPVRAVRRAARRQRVGAARAGVMSEWQRRTASCSPRSRSAGAARARSRSRCRSARSWCCSMSSPW